MGHPGFSGFLGPRILDFPGWNLLETLLSNVFSNLENVGAYAIKLGEVLQPTSIFETSRCSIKCARDSLMAYFP
jgi:hypothetical protein